MSTTEILLLGATGYIGGTVLARLLEIKRQSFHITILVRSADKAAKFNAFSKDNKLAAVVGSLEEGLKLEGLAANAQYVFNCADADNLEATKAILRGLEKRYQETGVKPVLIHTSGTGVLSDDAQGMYTDDKIYSDLDIKMLESLPRNAPHRRVDLAIVDASDKGYVQTYIVLPSTIYGVVSTPFTSPSLNLQKNHSQQIPALIRASLERGQGGMIGQGKNMWGNVSIHDVADLYILLFLTIMRNPTPPRPASGHFGFYFASSDEHELSSISFVISQVLFELGESKSEDVTSFTEEEIQKYFGGSTSLGSNSRCRADRSRKLLGWRPNMGTDDMFESIELEVKAFLKDYNVE